MKRRAPLALLILAVVLAGFLLWKGSWGPGEGLDFQDGAADVSPELLNAVLKGTGGPATEVAERGAQLTIGPEGPAEPAGLRGRVVDAETGEGISRARLFLWPGNEPPPDDVSGTFFLAEASHGVLPLYPHILYATDDEGRFTFQHGFERIGRGQHLYLHAFGGTHLRDYAPVEIPGEAEIRLQRGRTLTGWVVDAGRRPVPGARVRAYAHRDLGPDTDKGVHPKCVHASAYAREDGAFTLGGVSPEGVVVDALSPAGRCSAGLWVPAGDAEPLEVRVPREVRVTLLVRAEDGGPLPLGYLSSYAPHWDTVLWKTAWGEDAPTERRVRSTPLPPGPLREELLLWVPGYLARGFALEPEASEQTHELVMVRKVKAGTVRLRIGWPDAEGAGRNPLFVRVVDPAMTWERGRVVLERRVVPPGTGEVVLGPLPAANYLLEGIGRGVGRFTAQIHAVAGEETTFDVDLVAAGTLEVTFEDAPATGVGFGLSWAEGSANERFERIGGGIQDHDRLEQTVWGEEDLRDGSRWGDWFVAVPDGRGAAVGRVFGLPPRRFDLDVYLWHLDEYEGTAIEIRAGETTRVKIRRKE